VKPAKAKRDGQELTLAKGERRPIRVRGEIVGFLVCLRTGRNGGKVRAVFMEKRT
jgi:hypothetical protein